MSNMPIFSAEVEEKESAFGEHDCSWENINLTNCWWLDEKVQLVMSSSREALQLPGRPDKLEPCLEHPVAALPKRLPALRRKPPKSRSRRSKLQKQK
jgi:hypothetical protein